MHTISKKLSALLLMACASLTSFAGHARADAISLDQWYTFGFAAAGDAIFGNCTDCVLGTDPTSVLAPGTPWSFTDSTVSILLVSDGFMPVDQFALFDNSAGLGSTTVPNASGASCGSDILACLADPDFSHGTFLLSPGSHSITGTAVLSGMGSGAAFFEVIGVPEPASLALFGAGLFAIGLVRRKRA